MGKKFEFKIDHHSFRYFFEQENMNVHQEIWMELLSELNFQIKYIKERETYPLMHSTRIIRSHIWQPSTHGDQFFKRRLLIISGVEDYYLQITKYLQQGNVPPK